MSVLQPIVHAVSGLGTDTPLASWTNRAASYDYAIGGLPFLSKVTPNFPIQRKTANYVKQQIDQTTEPGEQTLVNWWLRSQSSFHAGTGITYEEPTGQVGDTIPYQFQDAEGVDVWTPGKVSLLPALTSIYRPSTNAVESFVGLGDGRAVFRDSAHNVSIIDLNSGGVTVLANGFFGPLETDGMNWYSTNVSGDVYTGPLTGGSTTKIWDVPSGGSFDVLKWVKGRLMGGASFSGGGVALYELAGVGTALPTPVYTNSYASAISGITESPQAIYASVNTGGAGGIVLMFTLDASGLVPVLSGAITAAELPESEQITQIYGYLGTYVAIATTSGIRIADVQADGTLEYGPISVPLKGLCTEIVGVDRYLYGEHHGGFNDNSDGLWRLDLGTTLGYRQFAWAKDLKRPEVGSQPIAGLAVVPNWPTGARIAVAWPSASFGVYVANSADSVASGFLKTGNIRFHMLEPKLFKYIKVFTQPYGFNAASPNAAVSITGVTNSGSVVALGEHIAPLFGSLTTIPSRDSFPTQFGPHEWVSLTFTLAAAGNGFLGLNLTFPGVSPVMTGYQLTALPAQKRQRTIMLPLSCYDHEEDSRGVSLGFEGSAFARLRALEALEEAGDIVLFNDLTLNGEMSRQVIIDNLQFVQDAAPSTDQGGSGWGGIIMATLRAVD